VAEESRLAFIYVEFAPAWIYHGWWFYLAPIVDGEPDRKRYEWLNKMQWKLDNVMAALGLPVLHEYRYGNGDKAVEAFLKAYPNGAILSTVDDRYYRHPEEEHGIEAWRCLKTVREGQLRDFVEDEKG
jgi:hypothetical protein